MKPSTSISQTDISPTASQTPQTFHSWSRLPDELKLQILSHLLTYSDTISLYKRKTNDLPPNSVYINLYQPKPHLFPFIETRNYKLATLAQETYYKQNVFSITVIYENVHISPWPRASCCASRFIRNLNVYMMLNMESMSEEMLCKKDECCWMFRRRRSLDESTRPEEVIGKTFCHREPYTASKHGFEALDVLSVHLALRDEGGDESPPIVVTLGDRSAALKELFAKLELVLRAKKVSMSAMMHTWSGRIPCDDVFGDLAERAIKTL